MSLEIRRPCLRFELDCTGLGKTKNGAAAFVSAAVAAIGAGNPTTAVVELVLTGTLNLNRIALDQAKSALEIAEQAGYLQCQLTQQG